jgi:alpha-mannosidase
MNNRNTNDNSYYQTVLNNKCRQTREDGPLRVSLLYETRLTKTSTLRQNIVLTAASARLDFETEVDWNENRKFLVSMGAGVCLFSEIVVLIHDYEYYRK